MNFSVELNGRKIDVFPFFVEEIAADADMREKINSIYLSDKGAFRERARASAHYDSPLFKSGSFEKEAAAKQALGILSYSLETGDFGPFREILAFAKKRWEPAWRHAKEADAVDLAHPSVLELKSKPPAGYLTSMVGAAELVRKAMSETRLAARCEMPFASNMRAAAFFAAWLKKPVGFDLEKRGADPSVLDLAFPKSPEALPMSEADEEKARRLCGKVFAERDARKAAKRAERLGEDNWIAGGADMLSRLAESEGADLFGAESPEENESDARMLCRMYVAQFRNEDAEAASRYVFFGLLALRAIRAHKRAKEELSRRFENEQ